MGVVEGEGESEERRRLKELNKRWEEKRKEEKKREKGDRDEKGGKARGVTPDERTSGVNSPTGSRPGEPDQLPLQQVILGEGTSGGSPAQGRSLEDSCLSDTSVPGAEREARSGDSKKPGHREEGAATVRPVRKPDPPGETRADGRPVTPQVRRRRVTVEGQGDTPTGAETETNVAARTLVAEAGSTRRWP
jgi:hypothetical protein